MADVMAASQVAPRVEELIAESRFSGVVRIDRAGETVLERAAGWAQPGTDPAKADILANDFLTYASGGVANRFVARRPAERVSAGRLSSWCRRRCP